MPRDGELTFSPDAAYFHYVSNETVEGLQFNRVLGLDGVPRVCDMSSDFLSRPFDPGRFDLIYAHAQKNLGPAGITIVILRKELLPRTPKGLPSLLDYRCHLQAHSIYNTPPVFAIYVVLLVTRWLLQKVGDLASMARHNERKAALLYEVLDQRPDLYSGWAAPQDRSRMNVVFKLPDELNRAFLAQAEQFGFSGLAGHRSLGGIRASIYNAMPERSVTALREFMLAFAAAH